MVSAFTFQILRVCPLLILPLAAIIIIEREHIAFASSCDVPMRKVLQLAQKQNMPVEIIFLFTGLRNAIK